MLNDLPIGCLKCNKKTIEETLEAYGIDPKMFKPVTDVSEYHWNDLQECMKCGTQWAAVNDWEQANDKDHKMSS